MLAYGCHHYNTSSQRQSWLISEIFALYPCLGGCLNSQQRFCHLVNKSYCTAQSFCPPVIFFWSGVYGPSYFPQVSKSTTTAKGMKRTLRPKSTHSPVQNSVIQSISPVKGVLRDWVEDVERWTMTQPEKVWRYKTVRWCWLCYCINCFI